MTTIDMNQKAGQMERVAMAARKDEPPAPPFDALDRLNNVGGRLDNVVTVLIGKLQPYVDDQAPTVEAGTLVSQEAPSPLERRIEREIAALLEKVVLLEELAGRLRL